MTAKGVVQTVCLIGWLDAVCSGGWWVVAGWTAAGVAVLTWLACLISSRQQRRADVAREAPVVPRSPRMYHSDRR